MAVLLSPVVLPASALAPVAGVAVAAGVAQERLITGGRIVPARVVRQQRLRTTGGVVDLRRYGCRARFKPDRRVFKANGVCRSALMPVAVLTFPVVLFKRAAAPVAVLPRPVVLLKRAATHRWPCFHLRC
jgi:hypothetical protein